MIILELQGYIFFGTSNLLLNRIRARLGNQPTPSHIVLDFRRVTGFDSSVTLSLDKLVQYAQTYDLTLIATGLTPSLRAAFERPGARDPTASVIRIFHDLDHGLEFAENRLLATAATSSAREETLEQQLIETGGEPDEIAILMRWLDRRTYAAGERLISQGETSNDIFYVERGAVTVQLVLADGGVVRLRTMGAGTVVGEIAVYLHLPRSASVVAIEDTVAVRLSGEALAALRRENPGGAALLHAYMARQLAEKLTATTRQLGAAHS